MAFVCNETKHEMIKFAWLEVLVCISLSLSPIMWSIGWLDIILVVKLFSDSLLGSSLFPTSISSYESSTDSIIGVEVWGWFFARVSSKSTYRDSKTNCDSQMKIL